MALLLLLPLVAAVIVNFWAMDVHAMRTVTDDVSAIERQMSNVKDIGWTNPDFKAQSKQARSMIRSSREKMSVRQWFWVTSDRIDRLARRLAFLEKLVDFEEKRVAYYECRAVVAEKKAEAARRAQVCSSFIAAYHKCDANRAKAQGQRVEGGAILGMLAGCVGGIIFGPGWGVTCAAGLGVGAGGGIVAAKVANSIADDVCPGAPDCQDDPAVHLRTLGPLPFCIHPGSRPNALQ